MMINLFQFFLFSPALENMSVFSMHGGDFDGQMDRRMDRQTNPSGGGGGGVGGGWRGLGVGGWGAWCRLAWQERGSICRRV